MPLRDRDQQLLQQACRTPENWQFLEILISHVETNSLSQTLDGLYDQVDQSEFALADWIDALLSFDQWLVEQKKTTRPVAAMIDYIHCCTLTLSDTLAPPNLARITGEMLEQHGFDATADPPPEAGT